MDIQISARSRIGRAIPGVALAGCHALRLVLWRIHLYQDTIRKLAIGRVTRQHHILRAIDDYGESAGGGTILPKILICAEGRDCYRIMLADRILRRAHHHIRLLMHHHIKRVRIRSVYAIGQDQRIEALHVSRHLRDDGVGHVGSPAVGAIPEIGNSEGRSIAVEEERIILADWRVAGDGFGNGTVGFRIEGVIGIRGGRESNRTIATGKGREIGDENQVVFTLLGIRDIAPFNRVRGIAAVDQIAPGIGIIDSVGWLMMAGSIRQMTVGIVGGVQRIDAAAEIIHKLDIVLSLEWTPAGEIHINADAVEIELLDQEEHLARLRDAQVIPCRGRSRLETGYTVGIRKIGIERIPLCS